MKEQALDKQIMLAPLAGVTDVSFRLICENYGADKTFTEMVSCKALNYENRKTEDLIFIADEEKKCNIQLFGSDPKIIKKVLKEKINPIENITDISFNMGCPVPKVTKNGEGAALMAKPDLVRQICETLVDNTDKKVNIKFRLGLDEKSKNYIQIGKIAQSAGIAYVILHGRTKEQMYTGKACWQAIKELKDALNIPVIANGDVFSVEDYIEIIKLTGADGVMLARGAMGNPFLFKEIKDYIKTGTYKKPTPQEIIDQLIDHYKLALKYKREDLVISQMRKQVSWYTKGLKNSSKLRQKVNTLNNKDQIFDTLYKYKDSLEG
ncbi:MAG: tRNA dihydrouridine synthase DusB [Peptoniphilaceae bacterium]|nr:tRNA dihydrouridine synthase DusB [Peptoniphilaceae bacterium]MDY6019048.1 tRNA dihydrouridine synthase DusB [Anaerococcus sp.]